MLQLLLMAAEDQTAQMELQLGNLREQEVCMAAEQEVETVAVAQ